MMLCVQGRVLVKYAMHRTPRRTFLKTVLTEGISHFECTEQLLIQLLLHIHKDLKKPFERVLSLDMNNYEILRGDLDRDPGIFVGILFAV